MAAIVPNPVPPQVNERFARTNSKTTPLEASMLEMQEDVVSTLVCPVCEKIFDLPVATCVNGHLTCKTCIHDKCGKCTVCHGTIMTTRNVVIEAQLALVTTRCIVPECSKTMRASEFHEHTNKHCEFRLITCQYRLPAGDQCDEKIGFNDFLEHLLTKHRCFNAVPNPAPPGDPNAGFSACKFSADTRSLEAIFKALPSSDTSAEGIWPVVVNQLDQSFLLTSYVRGTDTYFWVTAMTAETEASKYTATIRVPTQQNNQPMYFEYTDVRIHNFHSFREMFHQEPDIVFIPYHVFLDYTYSFGPTRASGDAYSWVVYVKIQKDVPEVEIIDVENPVAPGRLNLDAERSNNCNGLEGIEVVGEIEFVVNEGEVGVGNEDPLVPPNPPDPDSTSEVEAEDDEDEDYEDEPDVLIID